ncbi:NAD(P)/FAD-dependent oxidoreductase [Alienimonas sp. DA493]|uniref:NAD(P)/FAD-dependent oxidoreductase n=1 Tax=Alienimonas sp. DA493 TaxID=3373605 RepID=UPI0037551A30
MPARPAPAAGEPAAGEPAAGEPAAGGIAVVGAGLAGLACARALHAAGRIVTVFDKGRGVGGRACTRREEPGSGAALPFDHGAQYFTVKDDRFAPHVDDWRAEGVVAPWTGRLAAVEGDRFEVKETPGLLVGVPTMNALPRRLAEGLTVHADRRVTALERTGAGWTLHVEAGPPAGAFAQVLVTAPAPQTAALLDGHTDLTATVRRAEHQACWAALLAFDAAPELPFDGAFLNDDRLPDGTPNPLAWAAREASKPGRPPSPERWTLHAKADWSDANVDRDPAAVAPELIAAFTALVQNATGETLPAPTFQSAHRWRFAHVKTAALIDGAGECLYDPAAGLGAAGDWCVGGRVEGAFLSGLALAERAAA